MGNNCTSIKNNTHKSNGSNDRKPNSSNKNQNGDNGLAVNNAQFVTQVLKDPLDKYTVIKFLGEGSFGKVHLVRDIETGIERAMKEIKKSESNQPDYEIINEIEILKKVDHPNIVKIFEFFVSSDTYYIITEYCPELTLYRKIKKFTRFNEDQTANIMYQLLSAVNYCHSNNIVHRDLKPENILIDRIDKDGYFQIKVIDFGTAKIFEKGQKEKRLIGSCYYIAPEVLKKDYNEKCDLWSCGVILYTLLCGYAPFLGKTEAEIYDKILDGKYDLTLHTWKKISDEVKELIKELLLLNPKNRPSANSALKHCWFKNKQIRENICSLSNDDMIKFISNLKKYNPENKLQQAVIGLIVYNLPHTDEINEIKKFFNYLDENRDGVISKNEFKRGLSNMMTEEELKKELDIIFKTIDADNNGYIEYAEFIIGCIAKEQFVKKENLFRSAFGFFDKDSSGGITLDELVYFFFKNESELIREKNKQLLESILNEIDANRDGQISYKEFYNMMLKIFPPS
jgi:calcium-dependent protein kinase